jgi:hypothetical protein
MSCIHESLLVDSVLTWTAFGNQTVAFGFLPKVDLGNARLVCKHWQLAVSFVLSQRQPYLVPSTTANAGGMSSAAPKAVFAMVRVVKQASSPCAGPGGAYTLCFSVSRYNLGWKETL